MDPEKYIELEFCLTDVLKGKMNLLQPPEEREAAVREALQEILDSGEFPELKTELESDEDQRIQFITNFLSYGIITEVLCDANVEDIVINNLKPIYIHHSQSGFIPTDKKFSNQRDINLFIKKLLLFSGKTLSSKISGRDNSEGMALM